MAATTHTAIVGLGGMGSGMAGRLLDTGHRVTVFNRSAARAATLVSDGATLAESPAAAARTADVVIICVSDEAAVADVLHGPSGVLAGARPGTVVADSTTTSSAFARRSAARVAAAQCRALDLGLLGNPFHARTGESRILVGGFAEDFELARPTLGDLSGDLRLIGPAGSASAMKIALNMMMGAQMAMLAEAATLAECHGVARSDVLDILGSGGYCSPMLAFRCGVVRASRYAPAAFRTSLMAKDMQLAVAEAGALETEVPVAAAVAARLDTAGRQGIGELDVSALVALNEWEAGLATWPDDLELPVSAAIRRAG